MEAGCYAAGVTDEQMKPLLQYAAILGDCFQIKDDIFDYYNDPKIGKPTGNDLREGKRTLPLIHVLANDNAPRIAEMRALSEKTQLDSHEIDTLIAFAKDNGGIEYAEQKMYELRDEAFAILNEFDESMEIEAFKSLFSFVIERNV